MWIPRVHLLDCFDAQGCALSKVEAKPIKDSHVVVICQLHMPGNVSNDHLKEFLNEIVRVQISRSALVDPDEYKKPASKRKRN